MSRSALVWLYQSKPRRSGRLEWWSGGWRRPPNWRPRVGLRVRPRQGSPIDLKSSQGRRGRQLLKLKSVGTRAGPRAWLQDWRRRLELTGLVWEDLARRRRLSFRRLIKKY